MSEALPEAEVRSLLNEADGLLGLIIYRNQRDDEWLAMANGWISRARRLLNQPIFAVDHDGPEHLYVESGGVESTIIVELPDATD